jgi:hypothetical protein
VPAAHRAAVSLTREARSELAHAMAEWRRFQRLTFSQTACLRLSRIPPITAVAGILAALAVAWAPYAWAAFSIRRGAPEAAFDGWETAAGAVARPLLGLVLVALALEMPLVLYVFGRSLASARARELRLQLTASGGEKPSCRSCGAPLGIQAEDCFARCAYCGTDSLVALDAPRERELASQIRVAQRTAAEAVTAIAERAREAHSKARIIGTICLVLVVVPAAWAFGPRSWVVSRPLGVVFAPWCVLALTMFALGFPPMFRIVFERDLRLEADDAERLAAAQMGDTYLLRAAAGALVLTALFAAIALPVYFGH